MYKKLIAGEFGLKETFWKFGVLGTLAGLLIVKIFGALLAPRLAGIRIYDYYTTYFNPFSMDRTILVYTVCYLTSLFILLAYNVSMILAVWRSANAYERSPWLSRIAKTIMLLIVYICIKSVF